MGHIRMRDILFRCERCGATVAGYPNRRNHYQGGKVCGRLVRVPSKPKAPSR